MKNIVALIIALFFASSAIAQTNSGPTGGGTGAVNSVNGGIGVIVSPTTGSTVVSAGATVTPQSGSTYTVQSTDGGTLLEFTNSGGVAITLPQSTGSFATPWYVTAICESAGGCTITPATSTIDGAASLVLGQFESVDILAATSTTYVTARGRPGAGLARNNVWTGSNTFGPVLGAVTTQSGTTYTFASTDCGTEVVFSNSSSITATIPATLPVGCNIAALQSGAGQIAVNGSAVTPATLESAHSYTKTFGQWAIIGINIEANVGGSAAIAVLTGDGA